MVSNEDTRSLGGFVIDNGLTMYRLHDTNVYKDVLVFDKENSGFCSKTYTQGVHTVRISKLTKALVSV